MVEVSKTNILAIAGFIGYFLIIIGVFLSWVDVSFLDRSLNFSGWDIFVNDKLSRVDYRYAPAVALIAGIISLVIILLPSVLNKPKVNRLLGVVSLIISIVSIILIILFYGQLDSLDFSGCGVTSIKSTIGLWIPLIGAAILALGSIFDIFHNYVVEEEEMS